MDISYNLGDSNNDLFAHSAQWNQLKTEGNILNVESDFLTSLEELCLTCYHWEENTLPPVTRCWSGLKTIELYSDKGIYRIANGVERGMFPGLTTVLLKFNCLPINKRSLIWLFKANIVVI